MAEKICKGELLSVDYEPLLDGLKDAFFETIN